MWKGLHSYNVLLQSSRLGSVFNRCCNMHGFGGPKLIHNIKNNLSSSFSFRDLHHTQASGALETFTRLKLLELWRPWPDSNSFRFGDLDQIQASGASGTFTRPQASGASATLTRLKLLELRGPSPDSSFWSFGEIHQTQASEASKTFTRLKLLELQRPSD